MRLLNVHTYQLKSFIFDVENGLKPAYAILSHTWGSQELTLQELHSHDREAKAGFAKIRGCCEQAKRDRLDWVWIDTCCIDKTNSTELSEAINSMYAWYRQSAVCYAFLDDVPPRDPHINQERFEKARWFTRGWCLQELIAPPKLEFYALDWTIIGTKWSLQSVITKITAIPSEALIHRNLDDYSIAQRMSWAANRKTKKIEDEAYCLLGIFDINMPLLYGEGKRAFLRLQHEILQRTEDHSFLIWTAALHQRWRAGLDKGALPVLAASPSLFPRKGVLSLDGKFLWYEEMVPFYHSHVNQPQRMAQLLASRHPPQLTSRGLRTWMLARDAKESLPSAEAGTMILWTEYVFQGKHICITIVPNLSRGITTYDRSMGSQVMLVDDDVLDAFELKELYLTTNQRTTYTPKRWVLLSIEGLEVTVSSQADPNAFHINYVRSFPQDADLTSEGFVESLGAVRLYSGNVRVAMAQFKTGWGNWPLSLEFRLTKFEPMPGSGDHEISDLLVVNLWLEPESPRCHAWVRNDEHDARKSEVNSSWFKDGHYDGSTDVIELDVLDDSATVVIVTKSQERSNAPSADAKPSFFSVSLTLFGRPRLAEKQSTLGGFETGVDKSDDGSGLDRSLSDRIKRKTRTSQTKRQPHS